MRLLGAAAKRARGGFALLIVLLALLALLVLCAPFLWTANKVDEAAASLEASALARHHLDTAARHARHGLAATHRALDATPDHDDRSEFDVAQVALEGFDPRDERGAMWQHRVEDVAALVDLNSAPPHAIANLLGAHTFLLTAIGKDATEIRVADARGFAQSGYLWIDGEIVGYGARGDSSFRELSRGYLSTEGEGCGPLEPREHGLGTPVIPQEAWALPMWRLGQRAEREPGSVNARALDEAGALALSGGFTAEQRARLAGFGSFHGDIGTSGRWQRAVRLLDDVAAGTDCVLTVDEGRFFAPGTTVMLREGDRMELALVARVVTPSRLVLLDVVRQGWTGGEAEVLALASQPINVNTASLDVLIALFENVALGRQNERVTASEARELASRVLEGRPWTGFEDLLERLVLPAAGLVAEAAAGAAAEAAPPPVGFLSLDDAQALWRAFENGNDAELRFATVPIAFVSRDTYGLELRSALNAPSGVQRAFAERHHVERIAPPGELLHVWSRQVEFEEALRIGRDAPGWTTGPEATSVWDTRFGASPPPRRPAWFPLPIEAAGEPPAPQRPIAPRTEGDAWIRPWVARVDEEGPRQGRVLHFDRSPSHPEGRLVARDPVRLAADDGRVQWIDGNGLARALTLSFWFQSRAFPEGAMLFDLGGQNQESDRVSLMFDDGDLVLRVLDGAGDHPDSEFEERGEVRFALAAGDGPGILPATWTHVEIDVRGNRPDQMAMRIDGFATARTPGLTRLAAGLGSGEAGIVVESTEGFPELCVLRIGEELIEARRTGETTFDATHQFTGPDAGHGGRIARERFSFTPESALNDGLVKSDVHAAGAPVQLHGYSMPLGTNSPPGGSPLNEDLGAFAVARVIGVEGASHPSGPEMYVQFPIFGPVIIGRGFTSGMEGVTGLRLAPADTAAEQEDVLAAFSDSGGYAAILQKEISITLLNTGERVDEPATPDGVPFFHVELVRYSGRDGDILKIAQWALDSTTLPGLAAEGGDVPLGGPRAFIIEWLGFVDNQALLDDLSSRPMIVPISVPANATSGFLPAEPGQSQFAQFTRIDEAEFTEWVRYDSVVNGHLVRDDPVALGNLHGAVTLGPLELTTDEPDDEEEPKGASGASFLLAPPSASGPPPGPLAVPQPQGGVPVPVPYWRPTVGTPEDDDLPLTRAARTTFQFRGVLGTSSHPQPAGTLVLPVWGVMAGAPLDSTAGWPGRLDHAFLVDASPTDPGWPLVVHRAYRPSNFVLHGWSIGAGATALAGGAFSTTEQRFDTSLIYVAAQQPLQVPVASGAVGTSPDIRTTARLVLFPSGERPRGVENLTLGGAFSGGSGVPAVIDEVVFGTSTYGGGFGFGPGAEGAAMVLATDVGESTTDLRVETLVFRHPSGTSVAPSSAVGTLPQDAGLLRIGEEWIAYRSVDGDGLLQVAVEGRGMLASRAQSHGRGQPVHFMEHVTVGELASGIGLESGVLPLEELTDFPAAGTVLIGRELVHHTARRQGALTMPRGSLEPGARDGKGPGLFRGRFGTLPTDHAAGTAVVHFPFRYWDRWANRADAAELHYFGLSLDEPDAFVLRTFFESEEPSAGGVGLYVLQRTDPSVPWDAEPGQQPGLVRLRRADAALGGVSVAAQTSRAEWRVFAEYRTGAFDAEDGLSHAWKETPTLSLLGVEYLAPGRIYRVEER